MRTWYARNTFLSEDQIKNNAILVYDRLHKAGFTHNAISAIIANMEAESTINPGIWEQLQPYVGGYGLVQWTPYEKYSDWAGEGWQNNGDKQCERLVYEFKNNIQFYATDMYPLSANEFRKSKDNPEYLASAFMHNYERPASYVTEWYRQERARFWFEYLKDKHDEDDEVEEPTEPEKRGDCTWLLIHHG